MFVDNVFVKSNVGTMIKVVFVADSDESADRFIETNPGFGVITDIAVGPVIFIANNKDLEITDRFKG